MTDLFQDVDEALQRDRMARLWRRFGPVLVVAALLLVVATGAVTAYRAWADGQKREETSRLVRAADDKDAAAKLEQLAGDADGSYRIVALMNAAGRAAEAGDAARAAGLYLKVADSKDGPADLRDLATIYYARAVQLSPTGDGEDARALASQLEPIAGNGTSPFRLQAKLDAAALHGGVLGNPQKALDLLDGFDEGDVPGSLKEKADALRRVYAYDAARTAPAGTAKE